MLKIERLQIRKEEGRVMGAKSRRKGASFERKIARRFKDEFPEYADGVRRGKQSHFADECDVPGLPLLWHECQSASRANSDPIGKLQQAIADAPAHEIPVAVTHVTHERGISTTLRAHDFLRLWLMAGDSASRSVPVTLDFESYLDLLRIVLPRLEEEATGRKWCDRCPNEIGHTVYLAGDDRVCGECAAKAAGCSGIDQ